eukprot:CAMPEP_0182903594 /NCGR_PEP_ID=MMETSP0034_2-20130328/31413_1 /TAXON_ID=156128 /ORGANISM="Nephroselmis pyriformis, Strain CCMP717" /LENGTH=76 /DNA_ID=CAMNT_0025038521 /DNA_START=27 /DNA_END=254 /DNA_ORIENTATION=+
MSLRVRPVRPLPPLPLRFAEERDFFGRITIPGALAPSLPPSRARSPVLRSPVSALSPSLRGGELLVAPQAVQRRPP